MRPLRRSPAEPPDPEALDQAWPTLLAPSDPFAGDERLDDPASGEDFARHARAAAPLSPSELAAWDAAFLHQYAAVLDGRAPWGATARAARVLALDAPVSHDRRPPRRSPEALSSVGLAHRVEDRLPDVRVLFERVLGPLAAGPLPAAIQVAAAVVLGKLPQLRHGVRVFERALKDRPRPEGPERAALRAVDAAPAMLWRNAGGVVAPALPFARGRTPAGPVAGLPDAPALLAMLIPLADGGWWPVGVVPLPALPPPEILHRRLVLELQRLRRHDRRFTWEDLLSDRPEVLYRTACEWTWLHVSPAAVQAAWRPSASSAPAGARSTSTSTRPSSSSGG